MSETDSGEIVCKVTRWYYRRLGLMALLLAGCGLWFLYDGLFGYPKSNHQADLYDAFQAAKENESWEALAAERGWPVTSDSAEEKPAKVREAYDAAAGGESWTSFSTRFRLPEGKPDRHPQSDIDGQFHWAYGAFAAAGLVLVILLVNAPKVLRADDEAFITPAGKRVPYKAIFRVDKRKWDNKGLAYTHYRDGSNSVRKAVIDDLKFGGAGRVLERVLATFEGELIERVSIDDGEGHGDGEESTADEGAAAESEPEGRPRNGG